MKQFVVGRTDKGKLEIDLARLVDTRALIQANSGGGKSWLMRLMAERTAGQVQLIVLDPEGEFATLREKFDMILVGTNGEIGADVRSAALLARKLAELQVSAVIDLYDLPGAWAGRRAFVGAFLEALMNVPKALYHPTLIFIDEAHQFCPEGAGDRKKDDPVMASRRAVNTLMSAGRKRGFCGILATQRLSKLDKDAAAECKNVFIGGTVLDLDQQRAGDLLGMSKADRLTLRDLDPGEFYTFGPALSTKGVVRFHSDQVVTTHPRPGQRHTIAVPKASHAIQDILTHLADLPQQAEQEANELADARRRIVHLERELRARPTVTPAPQKTIERVEVPVLTPADTEMMHEIALSLGWSGQILSDHGQRMIAEGQRMTNAITGLVQRMMQAKVMPQRPEVVVTRMHQPIPEVRVQAPNGERKLVKAERSILTVLAQYPGGRSLNQIALLAGYAIGTGGFNNAIGALRTSGYIAGGRDKLQITDGGWAALGPVDPLPNGQALLDYWRGKLGKAERSAFDVLVNAYPAEIQRDQLAAQAGYTPGTGGINNAMSRLCTLELAVKASGRLKANDTLFTE